MDTAKIQTEAWPAWAQLLLSTLPPSIDLKGLAELYGRHPGTVRAMLRAGQLPFRNVSPTQKKQFISAEVIAYLCNQAIDPAPMETKKRGRPTGAKNKAKSARAEV